MNIFRRGRRRRFVAGKVAALHSLCRGDVFGADGHQRRIEVIDAASMKLPISH